MKKQSNEEQELKEQLSDLEATTSLINKLTTKKRHTIHLPKNKKEKKAD